jgi:hypothetical protein
VMWAAVTATLCPENKTVNCVLRDAVCVNMRALGFGGSADKVSACLRYNRRFETVCWCHLQGLITFNVVTFRPTTKLRPSLSRVSRNLAISNSVMCQ